MKGKYVVSIMPPKILDIKKPVIIPKNEQRNINLNVSFMVNKSPFSLIGFNLSFFLIIKAKENIRKIIPATIYGEDIFHILLNKIVSLLFIVFVDISTSFISKGINTNKLVINTIKYLKDILPILKW